MVGLTFRGDLSESWPFRGIEEVFAGPWSSAICGLVRVHVNSGNEGHLTSLERDFAKMCSLAEWFISGSDPKLYSRSRVCVWGGGVLHGEGDIRSIVRCATRIVRAEVRVPLASYWKATSQRG